MISLRNGGWVVLLAVLFVGAVLAWRLVPILASDGSRAIGDGKHVATYHFDLSTSHIPREWIVASGMPRDGLPALTHPAAITPADVDSINRQERGKFLVPGDRVIGVWLGGQARAYPLNILNWHEVVNDTLGGRPIAVTYSPLCDAVVVFDRRVGDETVSFGVSGLLYNSNLLMYDRRPGGNGESLWSQLLCCAVTGPAAAARVRLRVIPAALVCWDDWRRRHPETTVLARPTSDATRYERSPYGSYFGSDLIRFPVNPMPPEGVWPLKTRVVVVRVGSVRRTFPLPLIAERAGSAGAWRTTVRGATVRFTYRETPETVYVEVMGGDEESEILYAFWFAWYSMYPEEAALTH